MALNGDPTPAGAAFAGVMMASIANGGSADDISKGVDFFKQLKAAGNFLPVDPTPATIKAGQTPVVLDWDYLNVAQGKRCRTRTSTGRRSCRRTPSTAGTTCRRSTRTRRTPRPPGSGRSSCTATRARTCGSQGGARPVRADAMTKAGTVDKALLGALPQVSGTPVLLTQAQSDKAAAYLKDNWAKSIG